LRLVEDVAFIDERGPQRGSFTATMINRLQHHSRQSWMGRKLRHHAPAIGDLFMLIESAQFPEQRSRT
jgi:hypothetical protein